MSSKLKKSLIIMSLSSVALAGSISAVTAGEKDGKAHKHPHHMKTAAGQTIMVRNLHIDQVVIMSPKPGMKKKMLMMKRDLNITPDQAKILVEATLIKRGKADQAEVGKVTKIEKGEKNLYKVEVKSKKKDKSRMVIVNADNGHVHPAKKHLKAKANK